MMRKEKGITLIALVVTIVVLLILAAVSISLLTGENGIITQAQNSKEETEIGEEKEKIQLAATAAKGKTNWGEITEDNFRAELDNNIGSGNYTLTKDGDIFTVTYNDSGRSYEVGSDGNVEYAGEDAGDNENPDEGNESEDIKPGDRYDEDTDITIGDDKITIPGGSTISKIPGEYESIEDGLVIYIIPKGETPDWTEKDENGMYEVQKKYDQFVWVPVKNAILDLSSNSAALASDDSIKAEVQKQIDAGRYPMAIKKDTTNYIGVLYQFEDAMDTEGKNYVKISPLSLWTPTSTNYMTEPTFLIDSTYGDESTYNNVGITEKLLQDDYNAMVTRVANKEGFWIGRYETSRFVNNSSLDTLNRVTIVRGNENGVGYDLGLNWYRMYAQQKAYKGLVLKESSDVTSSMIWGSQWDQIMIWMKEVKNQVKNSYYVTNSSTMGNFGGTNDYDLDPSLAPTGNSENYKVKNIFDLAGNLDEWSLSAFNTTSRCARGGNQGDYTSSGMKAWNITSEEPTYTMFGSRSTLY